MSFWLQLIVSKVLTLILPEACLTMLQHIQPFFIIKEENFNSHITMATKRTGIRIVQFDRSNMWKSLWIHEKDQFLSFLDNPTEKKEQATWAEKATSKTHHLTTENYDEFIKNHENVLIFFHALYAADLCSPMMDEWDLAAAELAETEDETYFLAAVDQVNIGWMPEIRGIFKFPDILRTLNRWFLYF